MTVTIISKAVYDSSAIHREVMALEGSHELVDGYRSDARLKEGESKMVWQTLFVWPCLVLPYWERVTNNGDGTITVTSLFHRNQTIAVKQPRLETRTHVYSS